MRLSITNIHYVAHELINFAILIPFTACKIKYYKHTLGCVLVENPAIQILFTVCKIVRKTCNSEHLWKNFAIFTIYCICATNMRLWANYAVLIRFALSKPVDQVYGRSASHHQSQERTRPLRLLSITSEIMHKNRPNEGNITY